METSIKDIQKQLDLIDLLIVNITMAENRLSMAKINMKNKGRQFLFGNVNLKEKVILKEKALNFWKRKLQREVKILNELTKEIK
ncbi:MAG: hypothetical protein KAS78_04370 [Candidatus Pacebacteria bacterium]|nr:hypothetical protein [Candidatus Paceibacterota bacterium]